MDHEQGLPRMAPFTPPCLRGVLPPQHVPRSAIRKQLDGPRARSATHGSLHSALPTWGSPSAASASFCHQDATWWTASKVCHAWLPSLRPAYVGFSLRSKCLVLPSGCNLMDREQGLPRMAPFTPPCLRSSCLVLTLGWILMDHEQGLPRMAPFTPPMPTWGSPSAARASFWRKDASWWTASEVCHAWLPSLRPACVGFSLRSTCLVLT